MTGTLEELLAADTGVSERTRTLVRAAVRGDAAFQAALRGEALPDVERPDRPAGPRNVYLSRIEVSSFRGIGGRLRLDLTPGNGLTIVTGRNGSGKSSLAEAVEWALTGTTGRLERLSRQWQDGLRNLHAQVPTCASLTFTTADGGLRLERSMGEPGASDVLTLNGATKALWPDWERSLVDHRPFLPHDELEHTLTGPPSGMFDAFAAVLGVHGLVEGARRAAKEAGNLVKKAKDVERERKELAAKARALGTADGDRAAELLGTPLSGDAARERNRLLGELVARTGSSPAMAPLTAVADIAVPTVGDLEAAAGELEAAADRHALVATDALVRAEGDIALLRQALSHVDAHGDELCPVCGTGAVDAAWRQRAVTRVAELDAELSEYRGARDAVVTARRHLLALLAQSRVGALRDPALDLPAAAVLRRLLDEGADLPEDPVRLAERARTVECGIVAAVEDLRSQARSRLEELEQPWREYAQGLAGWLATSAQVLREEDTVAELKAAEGWLKATAARVQTERTETISLQTQQIWTRMQQQSDVSLAGLALTGTGSARKLEITGAVGGVEKSPLAVMSQGELNALALSLFLPRAAQVGASPFRFVVIDDPVKAMDPAKIEGLLETLSVYAKTRQVIVFSHDERLVNLVRRHALFQATVVEVVRGAGSNVSVRPVESPVDRYLAEAERAARAKRVSEEMRAQVALSFVREALEAAAADHYWRRTYEDRRGADERFAEAKDTRAKLALALHDDSSRGSEVSTWLHDAAVDAKDGAWLSWVVKAVNDGAHGDGKLGDVRRAVAGVREIVRLMAAHER